jgi:hypothetical protein
LELISVSWAPAIGAGCCGAVLGDQAKRQQSGNAIPQLIRGNRANGISQLLEVAAQRVVAADALHGIKGITSNAWAEFVDTALDLALALQVFAAGMANPNTIGFSAL